LGSNFTFYNYKKKKKKKARSVHTYIYKKKKMINLIYLSILEIIFILVTLLICVALVTVAERKTMGNMQRRLGPNSVGYYGLLQAFADALKLLIKEYVAPTQADIILFFLGPMITLFFSLLSFSVIPFSPSAVIADLNYGILVLLAVSSVAAYGVLIAGWSANSKYAFIGSIRSTAQLISYELVLSSVIILIIIITSSLDLNVNVLFQKVVLLAVPLLPLAYIFYIGTLAETNRAPFDLAEAESELVSGYMTEHAAVIFVFFFLGEYSSILLMCILTASLFFGGYLLDLSFIFNIIYSIDSETPLSLFSKILDGFLSGSVLGIKACIFVFLFIWVRAALPRTRFDQLMSFCWIEFLPLLFAFIIALPIFLSSASSFVFDSYLLLTPILTIRMPYNKLSIASSRTSLTLLLRMSAQAALHKAPLFVYKKRRPVTSFA